MTSRRAFMLLLGGLAAACSRQESDYRPQFSERGAEAANDYTFAVHPLHTPERLDQIYSPLIEHVNAGLGGPKLRLVTSRDYEDYGERLGAEAFDFALPNPLQTLQAMKHGYRVFGKMADDDRFRGIILVRKDSGIRTPEDLRGKTISYPARTATAGTMMPQHFLHTLGVRVREETVTRYVGSQESSIMSVVTKTSDAAATWPVPWDAYVAEHPAVAAQLEVRWRTEPLVNNSLMAHHSVPAEFAARVARLLLGLHQTEGGKRLLDQIGVSRFDPADETTYRPVADFVTRFEQVFGSTEGLPESPR